MKLQTDFLVIGTGIAGLTYAIKIAEACPEKTITITTKSNELESNTRYAQGGIAGVLELDHDSYQSHYLDTISAGDNLNDYAIVDFTVGTAAERIREIIAWGASFDKNDQGEYDLCLEGGHSEKRILHHKDTTGLEIQRTLLRKIKTLPNVHILRHFFARDLIFLKGSKDKCEGALFIHTLTGNEYEILSSVVVLSTGGVGQVYKNTTNPLVATGDGIAMACRAGAAVKHMEFIQFHPTALYLPGTNPAFLISEAVRGAGAILVNEDGHPFMHKYSSQESLAPRDIVSRAIDAEMKKKGSEHVYLDCTKIPLHTFKNHFPNIYDTCSTVGIEVDKELIPVTPAAHYLCGGIKTNNWGQSTIENLFAIGECAYTGLHGANRLASNSLLEALVFAHQAFLHSHSKTKNTSSISSNDFTLAAKEISYSPNPSVQTVKSKINTVMTNYVGIIRDYTSIKSGLYELESIISDDISPLKFSHELMELINMATVGKLILLASNMRKENRGLYFNKDLIIDPVQQKNFSLI